TFSVPVTLSVTKTGAGSGVVTSNPAGVNCGIDCSATFLSGTRVVLTATPAAGSLFSGWSGDCASQGNPCTVTMDGARSVTASFGQAATLVVALAGSGPGTVTSSPAGINCGSGCSEAYALGTAGTLTAFPAAGGGFTGWE